MFHESKYAYVMIAGQVSEYQYSANAITDNALGGEPGPVNNPKNGGVRAFSC